MQTVKRFDFQFIGKNVKTTPQGFLVIPAYTARTGLQSYKMEDGSDLIEYRPEDEVFSESSMSSLRTAAVTNRHPVTMVDPKNAKELIVGHTDGTVEKVTENGESYLKTNLIITHQSAIDAITKGRSEISNGYNVDLDFTPGEFAGKRYDAIQRNIINNHIAIVDRGRAGRNVRLKLDSKDAIIEEDNLMKIKIGTREFDVADDLGNAIKEAISGTETELAKVKTDSQAVATELETVKASVTTLTTEKSTLTAKVDSLESDLAKAKVITAPKMDAAELKVAVKERVAIEAIGLKILDAETVKKIDDMSNEEIKVAVIKADSPEIDVKKLETPAYVDARFDHICEGLKGSTKANASLGKEIAKKREDGQGDNKDEYKTPEQVRDAAMEKARLDSLSGNKVGVTKDDK